MICHVPSQFQHLIGADDRVAPAGVGIPGVKNGLAIAVSAVNGPEVEDLCAMSMRGAARFLVLPAVAGVPPVAGAAILAAIIAVGNRVARRGDRYANSEKMDCSGAGRAHAILSSEVIADFDSHRQSLSRLDEEDPVSLLIPRPVASAVAT